MDKIEIMTIQEVATYLRVSERTVYEWAQKSEIPCGKLGTSWRFKKSEVDRWVNERLDSNTDNYILNDEIRIKNILDKQRVILLKSNTKEAALKEIIETFKLVNKDEITSNIFKREQLMSTGIGLGIAVPHVRLTTIENLMLAVGIQPNGIADYDSIDDSNVSIIFMILAGKNQHALHIKTLAAISKKFKNAVLRKKVISAKTADEVFKILTRI